MRVMVFVPGDKNSEAGQMPSQKLIGKSGCEPRSNGNGSPEHERRHGHGV